MKRARPGGKGNADIGGRTIGRGEFEPGWRWSENVKPVAGTDSCQAAHLGYLLSGRIRVVMDGTEADAGPRCCVSIPPAHDAEIVGDQPACSSTSPASRPTPNNNGASAAGRP